MEQGDMCFFILWRGKKFALEMNPGATLKDLGTELQKQTNIRTDTMQLIVPINKTSRMLYPFSEEHSFLSLEAASIVEGKSIRMMGVHQDEVDEVLRNEKIELRIAGFDEEEKRIRNRMSQGKQLPQVPQGTYVFFDFRTLHIPGIELSPPASEALTLMHRLAADPGIVAIMNKHRWRVGIMTEMAPVGYVGVSPKCILGFNKNHGEEISLRLRTDDLKGFRKYESIKKTLLHELAHMVHSEHDANFHALNRQLNEEAAALDWSKSRSHTLTGVKYSQSNEEGLEFDNSASLPRKLGGQSLVSSDARASSVAAAYQRLASTSLNQLEASGEEPDPDDNDLEEFDHVTTPEKIELNVANIGNLEKLNDALKLEDEDCNMNVDNFEPAPHAASDESGITSKTDADDHHSCESREPEPQAESGKIGLTSEPDPDDCEMTRMLVREHTSDTMEVCCQETICRVPDSNDSQGIIIQAKVDCDDVMQTVEKSSVQQTDEHAVDDEELQRIQDPVSIVCSRLQKAIEMLGSELNPTDVTRVLQTLLKIVRNIIEYPDELKFRRLRKANPVIQRNILNYNDAMEIISLTGFTEDVIFDETGKTESYLVLKHCDPGRLWLVKSSLEAHIVQ